MQIDVRVCKTQAHPGQSDGPCTRVDIEFPMEHAGRLREVLGEDLAFHVTACDETQLMIGPGGTTHFHPYQNGDWLRGVLRMEQGHPYLELVGPAFTKTLVDRGATLYFGPAYIAINLPPAHRRVAPKQVVLRDGSSREGCTTSWTPESGAPRPAPELGYEDLRNPLHYASRVRQVGVTTARDELRELLGFHKEQGMTGAEVIKLEEKPRVQLFGAGAIDLLAPEPPREATLAALRQMLDELPAENQRTIGDWLRTTPMWDKATDHAMVTRTLKELSELLTLFSHRPSDPMGAEMDAWFDKVVDETADVFITLYNLPNIMGFDLHKAIDAKMKINRARKWERGPNGDHHHVEGT